MGRGGGDDGQVVSVLIFHSNDPSLKPNQFNDFLCESCLKTEEKVGE